MPRQDNESNADPPYGPYADQIADIRAVLFPSPIDLLFPCDSPIEDIYLSSCLIGEELDQMEQKTVDAFCKLLRFAKYSKTYSPFTGYVFEDKEQAIAYMGEYVKRVEGRRVNGRPLDLATNAMVMKKSYYNYRNSRGDVVNQDADWTDAPI